MEKLVAELKYTLDEQTIEKIVKKEINELSFPATGMTVKECIDKQIPKVPKKDKFGQYNLCPNCKGFLSFGELRNGVFKRFSYCARCGQKIEWIGKKK